MLSFLNSQWTLKIKFVKSKSKQDSRGFVDLHG